MSVSERFLPRALYNVISQIDPEPSFVHGVPQRFVAGTVVTGRRSRSIFGAC